MRSSRRYHHCDAVRLDDLRDADGIWRLLCTMTRRKVIDQIRHSAARQSVGESALQDVGLDAFTSADPTPAAVAVVTDVIEQLFDVLPEKYHVIALKKLECMTVPEIADHCGVHVSTVERRLRIIREFWSQSWSDS